MRVSTVSAFVLLALVVSAGPTLAEPAPDTPALRLVVDLTDGSRVLGTANIKTLPFIAKYGKMDLVMSEVASIELAEDRERAKITMKNGDRLQGVLDIGDLKLQTLLGEISVPIRHVSRIAVTGGPIGRGLVLYYSFDEKDEIARDLSGKGNHGKVLGAKWTAEGKMNGALNFNGISDHVDIGTVDLGKAHTVCFWINPESRKVSPVGGSGNTYAPYISQTELWYNRGGEDQAGVGYVIGLDTWTHIAVSRDERSVSFYANGAQIGTTRKLVHNESFSLKYIGQNNDKFHVKGTIDEVMVFNRALSAEEVQLLSKSP